LGEIRKALADIKNKKDGYSDRIDEVEKMRASNAQFAEKNNCNIRLIPSIVEKKQELTTCCKSLEKTEKNYKTVSTFGTSPMKPACAPRKRLSMLITPDQK